MKVQARKELEGLLSRVELELDTTLKERRKLDLSVPKNYDIFVTFYNSQGAKAQAQLTNSTPLICVNVAPLIIDQLKEEYREKLGRVMYYFDIVRDFLGNPPEDAIFSVIRHPVKAIRQFEESFPSQEALREYQDFFRERGTDYQFYKKITIKNAKLIRETIKEMLPRIQAAFKTADLSSLRHEMDHVDFFSSPMYSDYHSKRKKAVELGQRLHILKDKSVSKEYACANMEVLDCMVESIPLLEVRALFFNYIKPDEWDKTDFNDVKRKVYSNFIYGYIEGGLPEDVLDKLVSVAWSEGRMDRQTSNYLFAIVNRQRESPNAMRYVVRPEKVNYDVANRILYQELPEWKNRFAANGRTAVEAIGNAYRNNPSRLREANKARTFKEFIELCLS